MMDAAAGRDDVEFDVLATKRGAPRASAHVFIDVASEHNFWTGLTMNLSEGGVFVATHHVVPPGSLVSLHLDLPKTERIVALGVVCWARPFSGDDDVPPGLGIQFTRIDALESLAKIRKFVKNVRTPFLFEH